MAEGDLTIPMQLPCRVGCAFFIAMCLDHRQIRSIVPANANRPSELFGNPHKAWSEVVEKMLKMRIVPAIPNSLNILIEGAAVTADVGKRLLGSQLLFQESATRRVQRKRATWIAEEISRLQEKSSCS